MPGQPTMKKKKRMGSKLVLERAWRLLEQNNGWLFSAKQLSLPPQPSNVDSSTHFTVSGLDNNQTPITLISIRSAFDALRSKDEYTTERLDDVCQSY